MSPRPLRKMRIPIGRCPATGKVMFDHNCAQGVLSDARKEQASNPFRRECRIYRCPDCDAWHLTSKEARDA